uniref:Uncharacterized protein n=1 Tax=Rhodnius prolixus TaxID=13249 RepID=T1HXS2_RHOPR
MPPLKIALLPLKMISKALFVQHHSRKKMYVQGFLECLWVFYALIGRNAIDCVAEVCVNLIRSRSFPWKGGVIDLHMLQVLTWSALLTSVTSEMLEQHKTP